MAKKLFNGEIELLKVEEIAKMLDCNKYTIRRYIHDGKLIGRKIGKRYYVSKENFTAFLTTGSTTKT